MDAPLRQPTERGGYAAPALVIGYDKASQIAHQALDHDLTLREAGWNSASSRGLNR